MPCPSIQNLIDACACTLSVLAMSLACKILATPAASRKVFKAALRRARRSSTNSQDLPRYDVRESWESLCSDRALPPEMPAPSALEACDDDNKSYINIGGFCVYIFRPEYKESYDMRKNTVCISGVSKEPGSGNLIIVMQAPECRVSNCNYVSISEKSQPTSIYCSKCRDIEITQAEECVSENARKLQVVSCFSLDHKPMDPYYFSTNCVTGCTENVMHALPCIVAGRRVETVNMPGLYLEYDLELQRLKLYTEMSLDIDNVPSVNIKDAEICEITHSNSVHAHDVTRYTGNGNEFEKLDRCNSVQFCSLHAVNPVKSSKCVVTHGQCTTKVYNVTF